MRCKGPEPHLAHYFIVTHNMLPGLCRPCSAVCRLPEPHLAHHPIIMPGTKLGPPQVKESDVAPPQGLWHEDGPRGGYGGRGGRGGGRGMAPHVSAFPVKPQTGTHSRATYRLLTGVLAGRRGRAVLPHTRACFWPRGCPSVDTSGEWSGGCCHPCAFTTGSCLLAPAGGLCPGVAAVAVTGR